MPAKIQCISYYLPKNILTNEELSNQFPEWSAEDIYLKTGIKKRHITDWDEIASDCATKAAEKLFEEHHIDRSEIDFLIFVTQTNDYVSPTTACLIQRRLNLKTSIGAFDINLGCSGFVYGLSVAKAMVNSGVAKNLLLLTSEVLSKYLHHQDKSSRTIFGDAGAAILVSNGEKNQLGEFVFGTDGNETGTMLFPNRGFRRPLLHQWGIDYKDEYGNIFNDNYFHMNGPEVFLFSMKRVPPMIAEVLEKNNLGMDDIDLGIFHQANGYMLEALRKKLKIPDDKFYMYMEEVGNTVSSSIPIALYEAEHTGKVKRGDRVLLAAFGVGLSWGACVMEW